MSRLGMLIATAVAVAVIAPTSANAAKLECKSAVTSPLVLTTSDVEPSWRTAVTNSLGADWADFGRAKNKQYGEINLAVAVMHYVTAQPCRPWRPAVNVLNNGALLKVAP